MKRLSLFGFLLATMPLVSNAHPGHGDPGGFTITHYLVEPEHVFLSACLLAFTVASILHFKKIKSKAPANKANEKTGV